MKLAVFGSRSLQDDARIWDTLDGFLQENPQYDTIVTSQEPSGVCLEAQIYARRNHMVLELHFLNMARYARGAHERRSDAIIKAADFVLLIHDGTSHGTKNELERTKKFNKPFKYIVMDMGA